LGSLGVVTDSDSVDLALKNSWGYALQAGVNVAINNDWGLHFMVSKMDIDTTGDVRVNGNTIQSVDVDIDPYVAMAGVRYNF
jgi:outer membrane protein